MEVGLDITERKRAEAAVEAERRWLFEVLEALPVMICLLTPNHQVVFANRPFRERYGESNGRRCYEYCYGRERPCEFCESFQVLKTDQPHHWEVLAADGSVIDRYDLPFKDANGSPLVLEMDIDITARRKAEEALRLKTEEMEQFFSLSLDLLCIAGTDARFRRLNPAWETTLGYSLEELKAGQFLDFVHPDDRNATIEAVSQLAAQREVTRFVNRYRCRDGSYRWMEWRSAPAGEFIYAAARDITENRKVEDRIQRYTEDLQRSNKELEQFAYIASHDLQEPLRSVSSFSQLLARRYQGRLDSDADEFIGFIVTGVTRMQTLINDLLAYSRVGTRGKPFAPVSCEAMVQAARENLEAAFVESGAVVTHDPLPTVPGDSTQLVQLFQNLFSNSIKFRRLEEAPHIHVSAVRQQGVWRLSVGDNGVGIDPEFFQRVFIIFQRLHGREEYPGTGIGLALCKKIVERHGGRMWVESGSGKGSTFFFTIPEGRTEHG